MKTWQRYAVGGLLSVSIIVAMIGCQPANRSEADVVMIGSNLELTGSNASYGVSTSNAMQLAVDEINNESGLLGKQIQLVSLDNRSDVSGAVDATFKLADLGVAGIIGPDTSSNVIAVAPLVRDKEIPLITPKATNPAVTVDEKTGAVRKYVFRATFVDSYQGHLAAMFAAQTLDAKKAAILVDNSSEYALGLSAFFETSFANLGGSVIAKEAYLQKDVDFKAVLTKIRALQPDILFVPGYYQEVGLIVRQARALGLTMPIVGGDGWDSDKLVEIAGADNLNDTYYTNHYSPADTDERLQAFIKKFERRFGYKPDSYAVLGYDAIRMLVLAIERAGSTDPKLVQKVLTEVKDYPGISGKISIDDKHNTINSGVIIQLVNGERQFLERIDVE